MKTGGSGSSNFFLSGERKSYMATLLLSGVGVEATGVDVKAEFF